MYQKLAQRFSELLQLQQPAVALTFIDDIPTGIAHSSVGVPSACTFWRLAEQGVFYATADDHKQCPIGMMTMGFTMPESDQQRAQELVGTMASVQYFSPAEVSALPTVQKPHKSIVYGRLDQFPIEADVVLCIINTQQAMLIAEAMGNMDWLQGGGQSAFGRPTCAIIPRTLHTGKLLMSFGCVGARTYTGLAPSELVLTLRGSDLAKLVERLDVIVSANNALAPFHQQQKARFAAS
ncbi:MAG: DUF169 domain-containing protein [Ktedonobacteraceae bacterium]